MTETLRRVLRWRWALIVAVFLPSALIAVTRVELQPDEHQAASVIAVVPERNESTDTDLIQLAVDRYVVLLQSDELLQRVAEQTGVPLSTLSSGVSVAAPAQSANLRIVAAAPTAPQARAAADAVADAGVQLALEDPTVDAQVLATAADQALPLTASPRLLELLLVMTALAFAVGLAYVLELVRPRVRTGEDAEAVTGLPLLSSLPHFGSRAPLAGGHDDADVLAAASELRRGFLAGARNARPVTTTYVVGLGPAAGGSTVAFLLARAAASQGESVALVDAEAERADLSARLGLPRERGLSDVLARPGRLATAVDDVHGVSVLGTRPFSDAGSVRGKQLETVLKAAAVRWDHVLVDVSAAQAPLVADVGASEDADVLVVVGAGTPAGAVREEVARWQRLGLPVRGVVLNRPAPSPRRHRGTRAPVVLMYHGFCTGRRSDDPENLFVEVAAFEEQLTWLLEHGWTPLDLDGFLAAQARRRTPRKSFLVTIDDAYASVAELAAPVLRRLDVPAVLFVPSGLIGGAAHWLPSPAREPIMTAKQLRVLQDDYRIEIGVHGHDHRDLRGMEPAELERQVVEASTELGDVLGRDVRCLAYPYGAHDEPARAASRRAGARVAFAVFDDDGPFAVSRVDVNATDTLWSFRVKLVPAYRRVWRALQRAPWVRRSVRRLTTATAQAR